MHKSGAISNGGHLSHGKTFLPLNLAILGGLSASGGAKVKSVVNAINNNTISVEKQNVRVFPALAAKGNPKLRSCNSLKKNNNCAAIFGSSESKIEVLFFLYCYEEQQCES